MNPKSILIPIAAFAVTVTGVSAFNSDVLESAGLTEEQISAFEEARELREEGDREGARDILLEAGVDQDTMEKVREAMHEYRDGHKEAVRDAVESNDYSAFREAVDGSPLSDIITSESDFELFVEAHELMQDGDREGAEDIFDELGIDHSKGHGKMHPRPFMGEKPPFLDELTDSEREALQIARQANDKEAVKAVLEEAGIELPEHRHKH